MKSANVLGDFGAFRYNRARQYLPVAPPITPVISCMPIALPEHIEREKELETPCQRICVLDETSGLCIGCGRTRDEVSHWPDYTPHERRVIMAGLAARLGQMKAARKKAARKRRRRK